MKYLKLENFSGDSQVKILSLNRPDIKNAFHPEMIAEITDFFITQNTKFGTKLIILRGEGSSFCSGADLNWMKSMVNFTLEENLADSKKLGAMFAAIQSCHTPVAAIVHGGVYGGALGLIACCDYVFAEEKTQFCFSEVKLGLAPAMISSYIGRKIQDAFFRPYMLSAEVFSSQDAKRIGLVHQTFSEKIEVAEVAKKFSNNGLEAMRETKKMLNYNLENKVLHEQQERCAQIISERRMSPEGQDRLKKFFSGLF